MPNWQPNWADVRFDHAAAQAAISELQRAARVLDDAVDRRADLAGRATDQWQGSHRHTFDASLTRLQSGGRDLADAMRREAGRIADAAASARAEQSRREDARREWNRQNDAEQRALQEAHAGGAR